MRNKEQSKLNNQINKVLSEATNPATRSRIKKLKKYFIVNQMSINDIHSNVLDAYRLYLEVQGYSKQTIFNDISIAKKVIKQIVDSSSYIEPTSKQNRMNKSEYQYNAVRTLYSQMEKNMRELQKIKQHLNKQELQPVAI